MPLLNDVNNSQVTVSERWNKLYRIIHHLFLKKEFIHINDYKKMIDDMNSRFEDLEKKVNAELQKIQTAHNTHIHTVTTANGPGTAAATANTYTLGKIAGNKVIPETKQMDNEDANLMAKGEAKAPLADRVGAQETIANLDIQKAITTSTIGA